MTQQKQELDSRSLVGKSRVDLIPAEVLMELGRVYAFGATKHNDQAWRQGVTYSKLYGSMMRHSYKWWGGETEDGETRIHHLASVIFNAVSLLYYELFPEKYKKFDDRWVAGPFGDVIEPEISMDEVVPRAIVIPEGFKIRLMDEDLQDGDRYWDPIRESWVTMPVVASQVVTQSWRDKYLVICRKENGNESENRPCTL